MEQNQPQDILTGTDVPPEENITHAPNPDTAPFNPEQPDHTAENTVAESNSQTPDAEQLQAALIAERDRVLRISAEFDNYKKRASREMADFRKFANESVLRQLLTVVDNLERAISSASGGSGGTQKGDTHKVSQDSQNIAVLQGVEMTYKDIIKLFETFSVKPVEAHGKPFDPLFHQAVSHQESDQYPDNTVIAELQKGYLLHERLLRPSMVVVSKALQIKE